MKGNKRIFRMGKNGIKGSMSFVTGDPRVQQSYFCKSRELPNDDSFPPRRGGRIVIKE